MLISTTHKRAALKPLTVLGVVALLLLFLAQGAAAQDIIWIRQFGTSGNDAAYGAAVDGAGNAYVAGYTQGTFSGQASAGGIDAYVRKYDPAGSEVWTRQFGTSADDVATGVAVDGTGNVYVSGNTQGTFSGQASAGGIDAYVRKYDPAGTPLWTRQFGTAHLDIAEAVAVDGTGNAYVAGTGGQSCCVHDALVSKWDPAGNAVWTRQFGTPANDQAHDVAVDGAGNAYVAGSTQSTLPGQVSAGGDDAWVRKYDPAGTEVWTRQFGSPGEDEAKGVAVDGTGNAYVAGQTNGTFPGQTSAGGWDSFLRKYDPAGTALWTRQFGTAHIDIAEAVAVDGGNAYATGYVGGALPGQVSAGGGDAYARKYASAGTEVWTRQFGSPGEDGGQDVSVDGTGNAYVAGFVIGALPGQTSAGGHDAFVAKIGAADSDGDGILDTVDACPNDPEDFDGFEDGDGCPDPDNDGDGILDGADACPLLPGPASNDGCPLPGPPAVGGIVGLVSAPPDTPAGVSDPSGSDRAEPITAALAAGAVALVASGWYVRRRWLR